MAIISPPGTPSSSPLSLLQSLLFLSQDLSHYTPFHFPPQKRNSSSILRKSRLLYLLFQDLLQNATPISLPHSATLCLKEISLLLHKTRSLLHGCTTSSRTWLLLHTHRVSNSFHELVLDLSTILDILPLSALSLSDDVREQIDLLKKQCARSKPFVDPTDETLRSEILKFIDDVENEIVPDRARLAAAFKRLGLEDSRSCRDEIRCLEDQIANQNSEKSTAEILALIGLVRYGKCILFGASTPRPNAKQRFPEEEIAFPADFRCPISLELMRDPVVVATGQTYDRENISRWIESGHGACPKTGQALSRPDLIPNRALKNQIARWCEERNIPYAKRETNGVAWNKAALEAMKLTASFLVEKLGDSPSTEAANRVVHELRVMAKTGAANRACVAEVGAIPWLIPLLGSDDPDLQINAVTTVLNLSILEGNKRRIMDADGGFDAIIHVLRSGATWEAKENAAATVLSLSVETAYRKRFGRDPRVVKGLVDLVRDGPASSKRDGLAAVLNLAGDMETVGRMLDEGLVEVALESVSEAAEEAAAVLAAVCRKGGAEAVAAMKGSVGILVGVTINGSDRARECAVAALVSVCRNGGNGAVTELVGTPRIERVLLEVMQNGSERARVKAASLGRICRRWVMAQQLDRTVGFTISRA
ncbi:U-box domain-containing protein 16-like protein [Cinnamomum micranthum f. kanehirae]|uniref:RING-type E3 ubiquitin transferase n=1 Tax=Cinnamomum micranthum f. kanehirae TaxID=337451 RepID=A0A3S3MCS9_9MAGN|nr:U-box domain-containing protein 16-like protein [Cinnamomum micranthum f. kanehirae]